MIAVGIAKATQLLVDFALGKLETFDSIAKIDAENLRRRPIGTANITIYLSVIELNDGPHRDDILNKHRKIWTYGGGLYSKLNHIPGLRSRVTQKQSGGGPRRRGGAPQPSRGCRETKYITELFQRYGPGSFTVKRTACAITQFHVSVILSPFRPPSDSLLSSPASLNLSSPLSHPNQGHGPSLIQQVLEAAVYGMIEETNCLNAQSPIGFPKAS